MRRIVQLAVLLVLIGHPLVALGTGEGTRHITGPGQDIYFMDDKVFGAIDGHPLWAVYNCGSDMEGRIDIRGTFHSFSFRYHKEGENLVTGSFGPVDMALGKMKRSGDRIEYQIRAGDREYLFSIRYERIQDGHMVNSIIEGDVGRGKPIRMTVDGHLCPFATTGIVLMVAGSALLAE